MKYKNIFVSLGSNQGDPYSQIQKAIQEIKEHLSIHVKAESPLYQSAPQEENKQPPFLNNILWLESQLPVEPFFQALKKIETALGNEKPYRFGPRNMDIDIIAWDQEQINTQDLTIPHPRMHQRRFVLKPLTDLHPQWHHPILDKSAQEMYKSLPNQNDWVKKYEKPEKKHP